jgi:hypothetical protein
VGWDWVPRYCGHFGLLYKPQMIDEDDFWSNWWNENWQGKPKYSEKTCPSATLSTTKSHMTRPWLEPRTAAVGSQLLTAWAMARPGYIFTLLSTEEVGIAVMLCISVGEVLGSNLSRHTGYPNWRSSLFSSSPPGKWQDGRNYVSHLPSKNFPAHESPYHSTLVSLLLAS